MVVVYLEADDLGSAFKTIADSEEPFDQWFRTMSGTSTILDFRSEPSA